MENPSEKFGNLLVKFNVITNRQKQDVLTFQKNNPQMHFSEIAAYFGNISKDDLPKFLYLESIEMRKQNERDLEVEKRLEKRYPIISDLNILEGLNEFKGTSLDISRIGMKLVSNHQFALNSELSVSPLVLKLKEPWEFYPLWINSLKESDTFVLGGNFKKEISELDYYIILQIDTDFRSEEDRSEFL